MTTKAPRYEKPEALARIPAGSHAVIEASAGTGKTYALEHLVLELLLVRKLPIEQILAVTFTDKAARELTDRVRSKLEELLRGGWREAPASVSDGLLTSCLLEPIPRARRTAEDFQDEQSGAGCLFGARPARGACRFPCAGRTRWRA